MSKMDDNECIINGHKTHFIITVSMICSCKKANVFDLRHGDAKQNVDGSAPSDVCRNKN